MPGIIVSLLVTLAALSFAFHTDDSSAQMRDEWQNSGWHSLKKSGSGTASKDSVDVRNEMEHPNSARM